MSEREIRLSIGETEHMQLLQALSESNLTVLAVKVNSAWLDAPKIQFAEGLQTIRGSLFNIKGYLESTAISRLAIAWVNEAIEVVKSLQAEV